MRGAHTGVLLAQFSAGSILRDGMVSPLRRAACDIEVSGSDAPDRSSLRADLVRLCMGLPPLGRATDWNILLDVALQELCGPLIWLRYGETMRRNAAPAVAERWRRVYLAAAQLAAQRALELSDLLNELAKCGVAPVVMKGLPLSDMLYGDTAVRVSNDTDLYVEASSRTAVHEVLRALGWRHIYGLAPEEGLYEKAMASGCRYLEVHSSVLDEKLLAHHQLPAPEWEAWTHAGCAVRRQRGSLLPVFLAAHLAKHATVPLLWWIDLATLLDGMSVSEREEAHALATRCRLGPHLRWAEAGVRSLHTALAQDHAAGSAAMRALESLHAEHPALRLAELAQSTADRARIYMAWAMPRMYRRQPLAYLRYASWRVRRLAARIIRPKTGESDAAHYSSSRTGRLRTLDVDREDLLSLASAAVSGGARVWIHIRGGSMFPAIPPGSEVRIGPVAGRALRRGDIVLARCKNGQPVLHRVHKIEGGETLRLKGDSLPKLDAPIWFHDVLAIAEAVRVNGVERPIPPASLSSRLWRRRLGSFWRRIASVGH